MISAKVIADSTNEFGQRLTSMVIVFPRYILAELNTHRVFSKNSASSRAIPFNEPDKPIDMARMVTNNPFIPIAWGKEHSGMQASEYFTDEEIKREELWRIWLETKTFVLEQAKILDRKKVTKQLTNRLIEPWLWHTVIITGSEWENFFALRHHPAAEIHMQKLAEEMMKVYNASTPKKLKAGQWHIPFGDLFDETRLTQLLLKDVDVDAPDWWEQMEKLKVKVASARCARVSYFNFDGSDDYKADLGLHNRLTGMGHWSPFEHCAKAMSLGEYMSWNRTGINYETNQPFTEQGWCGNFRGFTQYRKFFKNESKMDERIINKTESGVEVSYTKDGDRLVESI